MEGQDQRGSTAEARTDEMVRRFGVSDPMGEELAAIDHALTTGANMTNANLALDLLCERLGVDRESLVYDPQWSSRRPW